MSGIEPLAEKACIHVCVNISSDHWNIYGIVCIWDACFQESSGDGPSFVFAYMCPRGAPHQYDKSNGATAECTGKTLVRMRSDVYLWGFCMSIVS